MLFLKKKKNNTKMRKKKHVSFLHMEVPELSSGWQVWEQALPPAEPSSSLTAFNSYTLLGGLSIRTAVSGNVFNIFS